ncbi:Ca-activated chloride channel family protein [Ancylobacter aquaticus]|uniref:Ca-activated chloride channel family protein n=1 Tax=Ancylobacter aquaticus TaxID=100 RepID=A0A4R1I6A4_ANCAQ|nr:vWA domain-containing protein [Ancylobacter aquaticus]TCK29010.1 Ca-activated chloride channel family protein [Ancylobacter aquaticus]
MSELVLLRPLWLAVLPLLMGIALWQWWRGPASGGWERVMPPAMVGAMRALGQLRGGADNRRVASLAAAALLCLGLSGPAVPRKNAPLLAGSGAILIAIDLSPSVAEGPALADAQAAAAALLTAAAGRPVGLLVYSGEAYEVAAPTSDPATLESQIAVLGRETLPGGGSRPASALALARQMLQASRDADLVLISDGGGLDDAARAEAERLAGEGVRLSILTLDGAAGGTADIAGLETLGSLAAAARAPAPVLRRLARQGALEPDPVLATLAFLDLGPFLAGLAGLSLLGLFRRRG